jgi:hypothetical protein
MSAKLPIELLEAELSTLEHCLEKSIECHNLPDNNPRHIDDKIHLIHCENLEPTILIYKQTIKLLKSISDETWRNCTDLYKSFNFRKA